jgi:hypothetical protein
MLRASQHVQVEPLAAALAWRDPAAFMHNLHDVVIDAVDAFEQGWSALTNFSAICDFSKNDTQIEQLQTYTEHKILAVLPLTRHLAPFYDAMVCSRAYSRGMQERTVQSLDAIFEVVGKLAGLLLLSILTVVHDAAVNLISEFASFIQECVESGSAMNSARCPSDEAIELSLSYLFTADMYQALTTLFTSITAEMQEISYYCLTATMRAIGERFADDSSELRQALWQLVVDADNAVYSQWHLRFMLTKLWFVDASAIASGLSTLSNSVVSGWSQVITADVLNGHIPSDAGALRPGYNMLIKRLQMFNDSDSDSGDTTASDTNSVTQLDSAEQVTQSNTESAQVDAVMQMLLQAYNTTLSNVLYVLEIAYSKYIENDRAEKLLLQPLLQALLSGVSNLQLSIELRAMVAIYEMSSFSTVIVDDRVEDTTVDKETTEQLFGEWVTSIINFCTQYVLKKRQT